MFTIFLLLRFFIFPVYKTSFSGHQKGHTFQKLRHCMTSFQQAIFRKKSQDRVFEITTVKKSPFFIVKDPPRNVSAVKVYKKYRIVTVPLVFLTTSLLWNNNHIPTKGSIGDD